MIDTADINKWNDAASNSLFGVCRIAAKTTEPDANALVAAINATPKRRKYQDLRRPYTSQEMTLVAVSINYDGGWIVNGFAHKASCSCVNCKSATMI